MNEIRFVKQLTSTQKEEVGIIAYEAFQAKIKYLWLFNKTEKQALDFIRYACVFENGIYALVNDQVYGFIAIDRRKNPFLKYGMKELRCTFGLWGGILRCFYHVFLSLLEKRLKEGEASIQMIAVDQKARGQGLGEQLLNHVFEQEKDKNVSKIYLDVVDTNPKAKKLYEKLGFTTIKTHEYKGLANKAGFKKSFYMCKEL